MDRVRNDEMQKRTGVGKELAERAEQGVLRWIAHVERMEEERLVMFGSDMRSVRPRGMSVEQERAVVRIEINGKQL